ncbi:unnamed protein product [Brassica oleracea]
MKNTIAPAVLLMFSFLLTFFSLPPLHHDGGHQPHCV